MLVLLDLARRTSAALLAMVGQSLVQLSSEVEHAVVTSLVVPSVSFSTNSTGLNLDQTPALISFVQEEYVLVVVL